MPTIRNMGTGTARFKEGIICSGSTGETSLNVYGSANGQYIAVIDNDENTSGHVLKLATDGNGANTRILEMEDGDGDIVFRARADGRFGFGPDGVSSMGAGTFVVGIDNSSHTSDIAISQRLQHLGDSDTYMQFPSNDNIEFSAGGVTQLKIDNASVTTGDMIVSGTLRVNLEGDGEALKIVGTLDHENFIVFEQPAGSNRAYFGLDAGDNLDVVNMSNNDDINFFTTSGDTKATMVLTAHNRVGVGKFGWAGKTEYGMNEAFPRDELDVSGSMRVSENVELMGQSLVVSGTITGRYDDQIPGNALMFKNTEVYFVTTDDDVDNKTMAPDENIFFSGSIGSMNTATKGTAVFGGDVVMSGSLVVESRTSFEDYMIISVSADNTDLQTGTGLVTLRAPFAMDLYQAPRASLSTNGTSQTTIDINVNGSTIMNTNKLTLDANEGTSVTAATAAALTTTSISDDDQITIDVDTAGTGARGLKVTLYYRRTF